MDTRDQKRQTHEGNGEPDVRQSPETPAPDSADPAADGHMGQTSEASSTGSDMPDATIFGAIQTLWTERSVLAGFVGVFLLVGAVFLLGSRSEYRTGATLMPEKSTDQGIGNLGMLGQVGNLLGSSIPTDLLQSSATRIPAELYPEIAKSTGLQVALLNYEVYVPGQDRRMTLYRYLAEHKPFSLWESAAQLPVRLFAGEMTDGEPVPADTNIVRLSRGQLRIVEDLRDRVSSEFDIQQGVVKVSASMPDPEVAAQVADALVRELTQYVTEYRSQRQRRKLDFVNQLHSEAQTRFNTSLNSLANFRDSHRNLARDLARTEEQRLQAEYEIAFSLYNSLSSRLEEARIQVQEETPVFKVLQPVTVPVEKSYPPTFITLLLCGVLGGLVGSGFVFFRPSWLRLRDIFRSN